MIDGEKYYAHRLAWFYAYGRWPKEKLDHRDGPRDANKLDNLREANDLQNARNSRIGRNNTSGLKGVSLFKRDGTWRAQITVDSKNIHLGYFETAVEAHAAYRYAAERYHGDFARMA
jgi:hypothetical protein